MDPQNKNSCPLGQEFLLCGSTKVHQVQYGNIKDLVYFSGPTNQKILVLKDNNFLHRGSTKVHKLFLSHFAKPNGLQWTQKPENLGPLKSTSLFFLTLQNLMDFNGPFGSTKVHEFGPLKFKKTKQIGWSTKVHESHLQRWRWPFDMTSIRSEGCIKNLRVSRRSENIQ